MPVLWSLLLACVALLGFVPSPESARTVPVPEPAIAPAAADSTLDAARTALARGLAWRASLLLAPLLRDSATRTPETVMLAATAASGWGGWMEVGRLLDGQAWLDSAFDGAGRALSARAALERQENLEAAQLAAAAVGLATDDRARGERMVIRARALDRLDSLAPAAEAYTAAARLLPEVADWLLYRAAIATTDSTARRAAFAALNSPLAREKVAPAEAEALRRAGHLERSAAAYAALGSYGDAYRIRREAAVTDTAKARLRRELLEILRTHLSTPQARAAAQVLDDLPGELDAATELLVGRAITAAGGSRARAVDAYRRALTAGLGTNQDRNDYAGHLFALGRYEDAARNYARVTSPRPLAASAAYARARSLVRDGKVEAARTALRAIGSTYPNDTEPAATALYLLGDLATDEQRDAAAREVFRAIVTRYPKARVAPAAGLRAALIAYVGGSHHTAALELDSLALRYPASPEAPAAQYWAGRAWARTGDSAAAATRWDTVRERDRTGYYGALASRRLGVAPWTPAPARDQFVPVPDVDSALARAALLERLGMGREARWEEEGAARGAESSVERMLATANAFRERDMASRAIRLASRALGKCAPADARTYRLLYPLTHREPILAESAAHDVPPDLAAALIRQESMFTPTATSGAGARGLMQVMPEVGRSVARSLDFPVWDPVLLYQADVNVQLGMAHLGELGGRYPGAQAKVLAAYNAGVSRVERWSDKRGTADPEMFVERIPYVETRGYVRIIGRNLDFYRALYAWTSRPAT